MAFNLANRVKDTAALITGTGAYTLNNSPPAGFRSFLAGVGDGAKPLYEANDGAGNWEVNKGTYTDSTKALSRDVFLDSSTGSPISWSAATPTITLIAPARAFGQMHPGFNRLRYYGQHLAAGLTNANAYANILTAVPIIIPDICTIVELSCNSTTTPTGNIRLGLYSCVDGVPAALLFDGGSQAAASGVNAVTPNVMVGPGCIFAVILSSVTNTFTGFSGAPAGAAQFDLGYASEGDTAQAGLITQAFTFGALPNPFGSPAYNTSYTVPALRIKVA